MADSPDPRIERRRTFIAGSCAMVLTSGCVSACAGRKFTTHPIARQGNVVKLRLAEHPELAEQGGRLALEVENLSRPLLVVREHSGYHVLSLRCTHLGCTVREDAQRRDLVCPCHGSRFTMSGEPTRGPAKKPLFRYPVESTDTELIIDLSGA